MTFKIGVKLPAYKSSTHAKPAEYRPTKSAFRAFDKRTQMNLVSQMRKGPGGPFVAGPSGDARSPQDRHDSTRGR